MAKARERASQSKIGLILLAYLAFISLGMPDGLIGVAWPSIRREFAVPLEYLGLQMLAGTSGYLLSSFFSGRVMSRLGVGKLLAVSCLLTGTALLGYILAPVWALFIPLAVIGGLGAGAIDAGINTYIASEHSDGLMQWLHASFGIGITAGPLIMTAGLNSFGSWRWGYVVVGIAQLSLALCFGLTAAMWKRDRAQTNTAEADRRLLDYQTPLRETLLQPSVWLSIMLFFIYTGIEMTLGAWAYTLLTEARGIAPHIAGIWAGSYWATFTVGRMLAGLYTHRVSLNTLLRSSILLALFGAVLLWWNPSQTISLAGVAIIGFAVAPIFPGMVSGTSARVTPKYAANTIGIQMSAASLGGAALPALAGVIAANTAVESISLYMVVLITTFFGLYMLATRKT